MEVGRIWKPQEDGTRLCFLKLPSSSTPKDTRGETGLDSSKPWVLLIHSGNKLPVQGKNKRPKKEVAEEIRMGKSFLGSTRQGGWPQRKGEEGSTPQEAKFLLNPGRKLKQWMEPTPSGSLAVCSPRASFGNVPLSSYL